MTSLCVGGGILCTLIVFAGGAVLFIGLLAWGIVSRIRANGGVDVMDGISKEEQKLIQRAIADQLKFENQKAAAARVNSILRAAGQQVSDSSPGKTGAGGPVGSPTVTQQELPLGGS